jgi:hypothetical protein
MEWSEKVALVCLTSSPFLPSPATIQASLLTICPQNFSTVPTRFRLSSRIRKLRLDVADGTARIRGLRISGAAGGVLPLIFKNDIVADRSADRSRSCVTIGDGRLPPMRRLEML